MARYRSALPQLSGDLYLTDAGLETDIIFNRGVDIREFAAHTLLPDPADRKVLADYLRGFLALANSVDVGFILDAPTWKAHMHWSEDLGEPEEFLKEANRDGIALIAGLRDEFSGNSKPIVLNAPIGPRGDAYAPEDLLSADESEDYHAQQIGWLAETELDMLSALTFTQSTEAIGAVRAATAAKMPIVVSLTVETDGKLPTGQSLSEAIRDVDAATDRAAAYFMVNCAHPDHFFDVLEGDDWAGRIQGLRCNASRMSHAELDESEVLDDGNPAEIGEQYRTLMQRMRSINVVGGCCGSDLRHVTEIAKALMS